MYTVLDILFAALILVAGISAAYIILIQGTLPNTSKSPGVQMCLFQYVKSGEIPAIVQQLIQTKRSSVIRYALCRTLQAIVQSCRGQYVMLKCGNFVLCKVSPETLSRVKEQTQLVLPLRETNCTLTVYIS